MVRVFWGRGGTAGICRLSRPPPDGDDGWIPAAAFDDPLKGHFSAPWHLWQERGWVRRAGQTGRGSGGLFAIGRLRQERAGESLVRCWLGTSGREQPRSGPETPPVRLESAARSVRARRGCSSGLELRRVWLEQVAGFDFGGVQQKRTGKRPVRLEHGHGQVAGRGPEKCAFQTACAGPRVAIGAGNQGWPVAAWEPSRVGRSRDGGRNPV